ncbi:MAG: enolase C-terminal domain-like protein, partial [Roseimicrobium sp.]
MTEALCAEIKTLQLIEPFRIAHGTSASRQVLRLRWGSAVGEAPFVTYYGENPEETLRWLQAQVWHGSPAPRHGPRGGLLALDLLWHDAIGKQRGVPLGKLLGLDAAQAPLGCRSFSIPDELAAFGDKVRETSRQFRVLKLKLGSGNIDFDEAIVARAYEMTLPSAKIMVDVNGGWRVAEAATIIPRLARYGLALIEQPIHHEGGVEAWRELRAALPCAVPPLFADESAQGADD